MAEATDKPALDPTAILSKLEGIVNANKAPASSGGGSKSWISTLIILAVGLVAVGIFAWISNRNNRELAKLRHEKEIERIQAERAAVDAKVATDAEAAEAAKKEVAASEERVTHLDAAIKTEEARYAADLRAVDRIRSWDDVPGPS